MAVSKAQYALANIAKQMQDNGINVRFAVHPVAGESSFLGHNDSGLTM